MPNIGSMPLQTCDIQGVEGAFPRSQFDIGLVRRVADQTHDVPGQLSARRAVIAQPQHCECIGQPGDAEPDSARAPGLLLLARKREARKVDNVVQEAYRHPSRGRDGIMV